MKKIPYTQKDFDWVKMTPVQMKKFSEEALAFKKENYKKIKSILPENRTYENTVYALSQASGKYGDIINEIGFLGEVAVKKEIRDTSNEVIANVSSKLVDIEYDRELYTSLLEYYEGNFADEKKKLKKEDIKLLEEAIRDYKRMGFDLPDAKQKELKKLLKEVSKLSVAFRKNINDYQDYILCTREELDGLSERFIATLPKNGDKYVVSLQYPHIWPFMAEATNRNKRKELAEKNLKKGGVKNLKIIESLVKLRADISKILGYKHHADFVTENRMAKTAETAIKFQEELLKKLLPATKKEVEEIRAHAKTLGIKKLEHYDITFVMTSLKKKLYDLDPETVRAYFPLDHVMKEMFSLCENLFGIKITEKDLSAQAGMKLWHKDVKFFEVLDTTNKNSLIGYFAMDLFPREGKYGHACMSDIIVSHVKDFKGDEFLAPFSNIICNFSTPNKKTPSLLSIGEIETLFHEFGHLLHATLSVSRHESQSGANVAWDFVETPSQIMENFVWSEEMLAKLSKHYVTGKSMPKDMIERIIKGKKFQNAYAYTRQIIMGKLDLDLHAGKVKDAKKAYMKMNKQYFNIELPEKETLFPAGFGHLVGYDAGYYSYLWALVYACDAFSEFENKGNKNILNNKEIGMKWRMEVLEKGSSEDEMKLIKNFLGRAPNQKSFLKEMGVK